MKNKINSESSCYERLAEGQLLKGLKYDVTQRVKPEESVACHSEALTEESKTDSSLTLRMTHAFTLAETMIVLVILGIVAAITVPALVRNQMDAQNRTRIKKAMTVYDMAINKIVVENQLKSERAVRDWADANGTCVNSSAYFKVSENLVENGNQNTCKFRTSDGVWWDITDILNPTIGLRTGDLDENANSDTRFKLLSHFDQNGALRVDDLAYEQNNPDASKDEVAALKKLFAFINNESENKDESIVYGLRMCSESTKNENGDYVNCYRTDNNYEWLYYVYDENGKTFSSECDSIENVLSSGCLINGEENKFTFGGQIYDCSNSGAEFGNCYIVAEDGARLSNCSDLFDKSTCKTTSRDVTIMEHDSTMTCTNNECSAIIRGFVDWGNPKDVEGKNCDINTNTCNEYCAGNLCLEKNSNGDYVFSNIENIEQDENYYYIGNDSYTWEKVAILYNISNYQCYEPWHAGHPFLYTDRADIIVCKKH